MEEAEPCQCLISHTESAQPGLMARAEICFSESAPVATGPPPAPPAKAESHRLAPPAVAEAQAHHLHDHLSGQGRRGIHPNPCCTLEVKKALGCHPVRPIGVHLEKTHEKTRPRKIRQRRVGGGVTSKMEGSPERGLETGRERFSRVRKNWALYIKVIL